jgi:large subunit ribosomal protein L23
MNPYDVIRRPVITEKNTYQMEQSKYTFEVARDANKLQIKDAVQKVFNVKVLDVNTSMVPSKERRQGRIIGHTTAWKKAVVTLAPGQRIEIFEGV